MIDLQQYSQGTNLRTWNVRLILKVEKYLYPLMNNDRLRYKCLR